MTAVKPQLPLLKNGNSTNSTQERRLNHRKVGNDPKVKVNCVAQLAHGQSLAIQGYETIESRGSQQSVRCSAESLELYGEGFPR